MELFNKYTCLYLILKIIKEKIDYIQNTYLVLIEEEQDKSKNSENSSKLKNKSLLPGSNRWPLAYEASALPTKLRRQSLILSFNDTYFK